MEIELLPERKIFPRALTRGGVSGVVKAAPVLVPGDAPSRGSPVHARHEVREPGPGARIVHVHRPRLAAAARERHRHLRAVAGRNEEVDRRTAAGIDRVGVHDHLLARYAVDRGETHDHRLLLRRLVLEREVDAAAELEIGIRGSDVSGEGVETLEDRAVIREAIEIATREGVLGGAPAPHRGIVPVLEPPIVVGDGLVEVAIVHRTLGRCRQRGRRRSRRRGVGHARQRHQRESDAQGGIRAWEHRTVVGEVALRSAGQA